MSTCEKNLIGKADFALSCAALSLAELENEIEQLQQDHATLKNILSTPRLSPLQRVVLDRLLTKLNTRYERLRHG